MTKPKIVGYFTAWSIYARSFNVSDIDATKLTHINYAFFNLDSNGKVFSGDNWADTDKHFEGDSWNEEGNNLYGNLKQLALLKKKYRHLKILISIGGWTWSTNFGSVTANPVTRKNLVDSLVKLVKDFYIDGIDIDWEYPKTPQEGENYVKLVRELRIELDNYAKEIEERIPFLITAAMPCGPDNYNKIPLEEFSKYVNYLNLMAYDFSGSWSEITGHQSNLYDFLGIPLSVNKAVTDYLKSRVPKNKIVIGIPMYGRAFENTEGIGAKFNGIGSGSFEPGIYDYKVLPRDENSKEIYIEQLGASYSYNPVTKELITYDSPQVIGEKIKFIKDKKLNGVMFWDLSSDLSTNNTRSLLLNAFNGFNSLEHLDDSVNHLNYPLSIYDNVKKQFN
ncbi:8556_t:CDS:2 [Diversispora eburnea]|uniref:chitinase n=1 Tax=Diversispora eburnea TaxID=1213867 RepID=A0A9N9A503_9GLOM|nr:8556_t:CDS:2 [Diversispora eburnea]